MALRIDARAWLERAGTMVRQFETIGLNGVLILAGLIVGSAAHARAQFLKLEADRAAQLQSTALSWLRDFRPPTTMERQIWQLRETELQELGVASGDRLQLARTIAWR